MPIICRRDRYHSSAKHPITEPGDSMVCRHGGRQKHQQPDTYPWHKPKRVQSFLVCTPGKQLPYCKGSSPVSNMLPISRHVLAISRQICVISSIQSVLACCASLLRMTLQLSENGKWRMTLQLSENGGKWGPRLRLVLQTLQ